ncbi:alpha/beta hydrolase [Daejeonella oryzae]|uniref:alpha/beta hydrolase n=1 Tax=Daejeonella oryzae TaxID=1122943 RepID=UPI0006858F09|nr:alpha/beta hydrolase family protein [Daejeonella oryzae]
MMRFDIFSKKFNTLTILLKPHKINTYIGVLFLLISAPAYAQDTLIYKSEYLSKPDTVLIFKPQNFSPAKSLPLVYLLHGYGGNYNQWNSIIDAQKQADKYGFILVCPDANLNSWYINSPVKSKSQFQNFFFSELYPDILKKYHPNQKQIFISGLSMGGQGALNLFIQKPELFLSAGSSSGVMDLKKSSDKYGLTSLIGPSTEAGLWDDFSVLKLVEKLKGSEKPFIFDCGTLDPFHRGNVDLMEKCATLNLAATFISQPGKHDRQYWKKSIEKHFDFFTALIK